MRLSVLDQTPVPEGTTPAGALANTLDLARRADALGYHRYWLAEHHGGGLLAGPVARGPDRAVAAATERHPRRQRRRDAPALLALQGRGGLRRPGRAAPRPHRPRARPRRGHRPADDLRAAARPPPRRPDDFPDQLAELLAYLSGTIPDDHPFHRLRLPTEDRPDVWLLGSSPQSAIWADQLGLDYAFADFINPQGAGLGLAKRAARRRRLGAGRRHRGGGPAPRRPRRRVTLLRAAPRQPDPGPAAREGAGVPARTSRGRTSPAAAARSSARPRRSAPASRRSRTPTAPTRSSW